MLRVLLLRVLNFAGTMLRVAIRFFYLIVTKSFPKTAFISSPVLFIEPAYECHYHEIT